MSLVEGSCPYAPVLSRFEWIETMRRLGVTAEEGDGFLLNIFPLLPSNERGVNGVWHASAAVDVDDCASLSLLGPDRRLFVPLAAAGASLKQMGFGFVQFAPRLMSPPAFVDSMANIRFLDLCTTRRQGLHHSLRLPRGGEIDLPRLVELSTSNDINFYISAPALRVLSVEVAYGRTSPIDHILRRSPHVTTLVVTSDGMNVRCREEMAIFNRVIVSCLAAYASNLERLCVRDLPRPHREMPENLGTLEKLEHLVLVDREYPSDVSAPSWIVPLIARMLPASPRLNNLVYITSKREMHVDYADTGPLRLVSACASSLSSVLLKCHAAEAEGMLLPSLAALCPTLPPGLRIEVCSSWHGEGEGEGGPTLPPPCVIKPLPLTVTMKVPRGVTKEAMRHDADVRAWRVVEGQVMRAKHLPQLFYSIRETLRGYVGAKAPLRPAMPRFLWEGLSFDVYPSSTLVSRPRITS